MQFGVGGLPFARCDELRAETEQGELAVEQEHAVEVGGGFGDGLDGDVGGGWFWVALDAGADGREGDAAGAGGAGEL